ncbi:DUF4834 family protein [Sphingobacterium sp. lm-10]|uniref:DUF4834 family protein n=1 Tax=Sphingobacterium sp. lm-10 TaxID=2944904 RepID=UPI00202040DE|nr:DUF4834 family protein [Sphingobacterium sp. lm-10]MCL7988176.1 DUF4834 family protein [Sphingobacterium sp. lm-10]
MEFLKVVVILVACYYAFKLGVRLLLPYAMKKMAEKIMKKTQQGNFNTQNGPFQYQGFGQQQDTRQDKGTGKVKVAYVPPKEDARSGPATAGEFVDFEEVK